jgi:hypothetical protein
MKKPTARNKFIAAMVVVDRRRKNCAFIMAVGSGENAAKLAC